MEIADNELINRVKYDYHPELELHLSSIRYIQSIVTPFCNDVIRMRTINNINEWINRTLRGKLAECALREYKSGLEILPEQTTIEEKVKVVMYIVIEYILVEIIQAAGYVTERARDIFIMPWDVKRGIMNDPELSQTLGIGSEINALPIKVITNGQSFTHVVTLEFVGGLLAFSHPRVGNRDFHITMFDVPIDIYYLFPKDPRKISRFLRSPGFFEFSRYTIDIDGKKFFFNTKDFMHGFVTGALWANVDHSKYWTNFYDGKIPLTI
jgi:hypothetical protein